MSSLISHGDVLIRISPTQSSKLEYSRTDGRNWSSLFGPSSQTGDFQDLRSSGKEIIAVTAKGLYYSTSGGRSWSKRA